MNVRETGIRRIRYVTRGLTIAGVAGSLLFAGAAKAATDGERARTPSNQPSSGTTSPSSTDDQNSTNKNNQNSQPPVNNTNQGPLITSGGS
jgi:hypothetical protein